MKHVFSLSVVSLLLTTGLPGAVQAQGPTAVYVNDASVAGDVFTSAPGSDATGNGTAAAPFATIERAEAAVGGATTTIYVDAGTYTEQVILSLNVNLQGAGTATANPASATIFDGGLTTSSPASNQTGIFIATSGGTAGNPQTIADLTVRNYDIGLQTDNASPKSYFLLEDVEALNNRQHGIYWNGLSGGTSFVTFRRVTASNSATANTRGNGAGRGLFIVNGHKQHITIEDSRFENNARVGIDINDGSASDIVVRNCFFSGNLGAGLALLGAGGGRDGGGNFVSPAALIEDNLVLNNFSNGFELKACTGSGRPGGNGSFVVRRNRLLRNPPTNPAPANPSFDNAGIAFVDRDRDITGLASLGGINGDLVTGGAWIADNVVRGYYSTPLSSSGFFNINAFGIVLEGIGNKVVGNVVAQCQYGIQIQDRPATTSLQYTPYFDIERNQTVVSSGDSIRQNRIDSCEVVNIRAINLTNTVDAALNWLGATAATDIRGASGTGGKVRTLTGSFAEVSSLAPTGRIDYNAFLNSNADVSAAPGFQGDFSFLNVDFNAPQAAGSLPRLQQGVTFVMTGGTVEAFAGLYDETTTVQRSLTLAQEATGNLAVTSLIMNGASAVLTLAAPLAVNSALTLTDGLIATTATNLLTLPDNATSTAGNASSYVDGPMRKIGNDAFVFPLGDTGVWARLGISAPASTSAAFVAEYNATAYPVATLSPPLQRVSRVEYWTLDRTASTNNVGVTLYWEDGGRSGIVSTPQLRVARYDGSSWINEGNGGVTGSAAAGAIASSGTVSGYGPFTFGSISPINPLPVELTAFRAEAEGAGAARLTWQTATEKNNAGFGIERSQNGEQWQAVGFVPGAGTSSASRGYTFLDRTDLRGMVFYRLRQVDIDGKATYSPVAAVRLTGPTDAAKLSLYPNPTADQLYVRLPQTAAGTVQVVFHDLQGRLVYQTRAGISGGRTALSVAQHLRRGTYLVTISGDNLPATTQRVVVE